MQNYGIEEIICRLTATKYIINWSFWQFPYSLLEGSTLKVRLHYSQAKANKNC